MNVLSLFDGISCGRVALDRAGINYNKYYASEIDKYAIKIALKNYPDTIQLGDINNWQAWNLPKIDLLIGGSPCQGFSFAGKQLNFKDERSKLFFKFVDILHYYKPKYFLLENVKMKKEYQDVISKTLGVEPIEINSALVSAQNRKRLYWTNISNIIQPEDKGILLKDILEEGIVDRDKSYCIDANYSKGVPSIEHYKKYCMRQIVLKSPQGRNIIIPENTEFPFMLKECRTEKGKQSRKEMRNKTGRDTTKRSGPDYKMYLPNTLQKGNCITTGNGDNLSTVFISIKNYRKLTPIECERLQTLPDNYTEGISNTQRYKCLGNGWTVDVIAHIFKSIK